MQRYSCPLLSINLLVANLCILSFSVSPMFPKKIDATVNMNQFLETQGSSRSKSSPSKPDSPHRSTATIRKGATGKQEISHGSLVVDLKG